MKIVKTLLAAAFVFAGVGVASAQSIDRANDNNNYDLEKQQNLDKYVNAEPVEIAKWQAQQDKIKQAMANDGYVQIDGFTYDPNVDYRIMRQEYKRALDGLKLTDPTLYMSITGATR
jgi:hypothetical protein